MGTPLSAGDPPPVFEAAVAELRAALASLRPDVSLHELPPPTRIAPYALALAGELDRTDADGEPVEAAAGRLVMLVDPAGQAAWEGGARFVCYARAAVEPEMSGDPLLPEIAWSWLNEALDAHDAPRRAFGGTVTTTSSRRFGTLSGEGDGSEVELRCSWSPDWGPLARPAGAAPVGTELPPDGAARYLRAFCDLLAAMAGLPPRVPGVVPLPQRRTHVT